jgi:ABC-type uncharacterized transport system ATPase subunit
MQIEVRDIRKYFGAVRANDGISVVIHGGAILGILGENGAGKSTLMKILSGFLAPDGGAVFIDGRRVEITSPDRAIQLGIGMLHQDPLDFSSMTVLDNFLAGSPRGPLLRRRRVLEEFRDLCSRFGFSIDPHARVASLSVAERQQLEILRLLWLGVQVLILDEPTTAISAIQRTKLFETLRKLAEQGKTVLFVSHKLEEVEELCHRVVVLRKGKVVGDMTAPFDSRELVRLMFGQVLPPHRREDVELGRPVMVLEKVTVSDARITISDLTLEIRSGEVIGLAGLEGSGQRQFLWACSGLLPPTGGRMLLDGKDVTALSYHGFMRAGVAYVPAERLGEGLIPGLTITEHVALAQAGRKLLVDWVEAGRKAEMLVKEFNIVGHRSTPVQHLSGGNQQRLLLALLPQGLRLLLMEHPTRGLDLESSEFIWGRLLERRRDGTAIVFASSDLEELMERSDRILVFFGGRVSRPLEARQTSAEELGYLIGGVGL